MNVFSEQQKHPNVSLTVSQMIDELKNDKLYSELYEVYHKTTVLNVFGIERNENRHSAFLKWLFDSKESHKLGDLPLKKLFKLLASERKPYLCKELQQLANTLVLENYELDLSFINTEHLLGHLMKEDGNQKNEQEKYYKNRLDLYAEATITPNAPPSIDCVCKPFPIVLVIENKVFSKEGDRQTDRYWEILKKFCESEHKIPIPIFLTPDPDSPCSSNRFIPISYQQLLDCVIEPLSFSNLDNESRMIIRDYIRNLEKPSDLEGTKNRCTLLAISGARRTQLRELYNKYHELFNWTLCTLYGYENVKELIGDVKFKNDNDLTNKELLDEFNDKNHWLIESLIGYRGYMLYDQWTASPSGPSGKNNKSIRILVEKTLSLSNRSNEKYFIYAGQKRMNDKPVAKSMASLYIFRAYLQQNPKATLEDLRKDFPMDLNPYYDKNYYTHLFYISDRDGAQAPDYDKGPSNRKPNTCKWDFFLDNENVLELYDGTIVRAIKMWRQDGFDKLIQKAKEYGIQVERV